MRSALPLLVLGASLLCAPVAMALNEYGIEGMGVVSSHADEGRASLALDGQRIVFASRRAGGRGGWDLWQATRRDGRWQQAEPLPFNSDGDDLDPYLSSDGRWLLFASDRMPGDGPDARRRGRATAQEFVLYRVAIDADGRHGTPQPLRDAQGAVVGGRGPALDREGLQLLHARQAGAGRGWDLFVAPMRDGRLGRAVALQALNSDADEIDGDWLGRDGAIVFSRASGGHAQLWQSACAWTAAAMQPVALSFNTADGHTAGAVIDNARPGELLLASRSAGAPRAGGSDLYRMRAPRPPAVAGCAPAS